jgi:hypothetical protein
MQSNSIYECADKKSDASSGGVRGLRISDVPGMRNHGMGLRLSRSGDRSGAGVLLMAGAIFLIYVYYVRR